MAGNLDFCCFVFFFSSLFFSRVRYLINLNVIKTGAVRFYASGFFYCLLANELLMACGRKKNATGHYYVYCLIEGFNDIINCYT